MATICYCEDRPHASTARRENTADHLEYIETILDRILVAGPLLDDDTGGYLGSCFVYDTDDEKEAKRLLHNDPYYKAGLYARVAIRPFRPAAGCWIGGKTW